MGGVINIELNMGSAFLFHVVGSSHHGRRQDFCCVGTAWGQSQRHRGTVTGHNPWHLGSVGDSWTYRLLSVCQCKLPTT